MTTPDVPEPHEDPERDPDPEQREDDTAPVAAVPAAPQTPEAPAVPEAPEGRGVADPDAHAPRRPPPYAPAGPPFGAPAGSSGWAPPTVPGTAPGPGRPGRSTPSGTYPPPSDGPGASATPAWVWPVLIVSGLVFGLLGGLLGGALVMGTRSASDANALPQLGANPPLADDNRSVAAVAAKLLPSTVQVKVSAGTGAGGSAATGSGFLIDTRGHVITNNHVVEVAGDGSRITVVDNQGKVHRARIVGRSPVYDVAVLDVSSPEGLPAAALGSSQRMYVGETVVAIGSPLGLTSTVTSGIVSALDRPVTTGATGAADASSYINAVQTDAAINPGNSGGPLVNLRGQVVGVNSAIATTGGAAGAGGNIGVGFAIPMEQVRQTARQILDTGRAEYPVIGATVNTGDSTTGAVVAEVNQGAPAARAGLKSGDRIVAVDDTRVADGISLIVAIRTHRPGDTISLRVVGEDGERTVQVRLAAKVG